MEDIEDSYHMNYVFCKMASYRKVSMKWPKIKKAIIVVDNISFAFLDFYIFFSSLKI